MKFENLVAVENHGYFKEREKRGVSNNFLVSREQAKGMNIHSWFVFERLNKEAVEKQIKKANRENLRIAVSYHKEDELNDCYEVYACLERAIEMIEDESLFVFKFRVLSKEVSDEYDMMFGS